MRRFLNAFTEVDEGLADPEHPTRFLGPDATVDLGTFGALVGRTEIRGLDEFLVFRATWMERHEDFSYEPIVQVVEERLIRRAEFYATLQEALEAAGLRG